MLRDPNDWIVGGRSLAEQGLSSFYFDIKVVDETNTKAEKAQYITAVFDAFRKILGNLHEESYIYVQYVRPTAYGFGGKTQEFAYSTRPRANPPGASAGRRHLPVPLNGQIRGWQPSRSCDCMSGRRGDHPRAG
jgi:phenylpyruvate tautomerase PptA (4-oxalocrotonate tautomerase family)